ncbi:MULTISPECIES: tail fiber assembly protein [unclassified Pantoea]|uniref:tail fiber assembly protein n=1 Tax=unclassified Pantoea TaxID=2630326 RepID=UPI001231A2CC|nr:MULTISPECIES: tail fiber assembly protein [unclassified Pantoea]KAA5974846.1 tail fiber assembly protein [Pantoea sp. M_6]KAA5979201.1 tail fiber assembly protein [Pantoea sp. M_8]KAA5992025.1 tail fiber assembly protein [Pantoea sp. M_10]
MMNSYALISKGKVVNTVVWDGEAEVDFGKGITAVLITDETPVSIGWTYENKQFSPPPLTEEELANQNSLAITANIGMKALFMEQASQKISVLQDAVDLEMATDEEAAGLPLWKKYRVLLSRIDANTASKVDWPQQP